MWVFYSKYLCMGKEHGVGTWILRSVPNTGVDSSCPRIELEKLALLEQDSLCSTSGGVVLTGGVPRIACPAPLAHSVPGGFHIWI